VTDPPAAFQLSDVVYRYHKQPRPALNGITATIQRGRTTVVLGPNGAGKSTLLYLLGLLWDDKLEAGRITYHRGKGEQDIDYSSIQMTSDERAHLRLREFGFVLQSCYLLPQLTCEENVALPLRLQGVKRADYDPKVQMLIKGADSIGGDALFERRHHRGSRVSGGQRQRFAVLRGIVHDPKVLFADEPFASVDEFGGIDAIRDLLRNWKAGGITPQKTSNSERTLVIVCHQLQTAVELADCFLILNGRHKMIDGRVLERSEFPTDPNDCEKAIKKKMLEDAF